MSFKVLGRIASTYFVLALMPMKYDALLIVSFGGPEKMADVMPFLQNVVRGRNVPVERLQQVAKQYEAFDGISPINSNNRKLIACLAEVLKTQGPDLPIYWGNRNWQPYLKDTVRQMYVDGVKNCLAFVTSAYSSYSSCRQYLEDIEAARGEIGADAPVIEKLRPFFNHPGFIEANADNLRRALEQMPIEKRLESHVVFTAHSIPASMAETCKYEQQLSEACRLVAEKAGHASYRLAFQSRSGPPGQSWLEPDILDVLRQLSEEQAENVVVLPIGFLCDHMEVVFDLDTQAKNLASQLGLNMVRAATVGVTPRFVEMIRELVLEKTRDVQLSYVGKMAPESDICSASCCPNSH